MSLFHKGSLPAFTHPTDLPPTDHETQAWQHANRSWWESHPMRYDWNDALGYPRNSREYFAEIDQRFFREVLVFMPWNERPFEALIPYDALAGKTVLEIGVGNGSHAQLLAQHAGSFTGIDITESAVESTTARLAHVHANAAILRMDAEHLLFDDATFDFIWTWGVIHHSADTKAVLRQMSRILKPGGAVVCMVYYRSWWGYYMLNAVFRGLLRGAFFRGAGLHDIVQEHTDGAIARFYSFREWKALVADQFSVSRVFVVGNKSEVIPFPNGTMKTALLRMMPDALSRFLTNTCRMGSMLVCVMQRLP